MNRTPACEPGDTGSVRIAPYMSACPRGSSISAQRTWSECLRTHSRFSSIVLPRGDGKPSTMSRSGSPAACASKVFTRIIWLFNQMRAFYSDTFVLPLPEHHRFPMAKYRLLRERLIDDRILDPTDLSVLEPVTLDEPRLSHEVSYVDAVVNGTISAEMQRRIGFPWSEMMVERSRRSAGATLAAAHRALGGDAVSANLAGGTHHSFADRGEG